MNELVVSGLSEYRLQRRVADGRAYRICRGLVTWRKPQPEELAQLITQKWPKVVFTGRTAAEVIRRQPLTFPLHVCGSSSMPTSDLFVFHRRRRFHYYNAALPYALPVDCIPLLGDDESVALLEAAYAGVRGRRRLEADLSLAEKLPERTRRLIDAASTGSDSVPERQVVRALRKAGLEVSTNQKIGDYLWDITLPKAKVAVEIDGYEFHRDLDSFIKDRWKSNDAAMRGWTVLRYSGSCVKHHLPMVIDQIQAAVRRDTSRLVRPAWEWHARLRRLWDQYDVA